MSDHRPEQAGKGATEGAATRPEDALGKPSNIAAVELAVSETEATVAAGDPWIAAPP